MATATQLEARARILADQDASTFPTSAQYLELLSDRGEELWGRMVAAGLKPGQTATQLTATGAANYTLGTDVMVVLSVERHDGVERLPLMRAQEEDLPYLRSLGFNQAEYYDLIGGATSALAIELFPSPATGTYTVRYIPRFTRFASGAANWYGPARSDEYIAVGAAADALRKEGDRAGATDMERKLDKIWGDIVQSASWQDAQYPTRVRDTRAWDERYRFSPFDDFRIRRVD